MGRRVQTSSWRSPVGREASRVACGRDERTVPDESVPTDDFDQTPAFDPTDPEPVPELDLDQTRGE
jgi:hypothetical protein